MSLKELTSKNHELAETTAFMKAVFDKNMPAEVWTDYTYQKYFWYQSIEHCARNLKLLDDLPGIERAELILNDYYAMVGGQSTEPRDIKPETTAYTEYIKMLDDPKRVLAHLYTWHMGDMFGGQMIKKIINAPHSHLEFENAKDLIFVLRGMLDDTMADEANVAFEWAIKILGTYDSELV